MSSDTKQGLHSTIARLEKDVRTLKDTLNIRDNWHSTIRDWVGREVRICDRSGINSGKLLWSDRYNVCVEIYANQNVPRERIYTKGGINWIEQT